jgi:hypothetical protein
MNIKKKEDNALRWGATGLLKGIEDKYVKIELAALLENQRKHNDDIEGTDENAQFKRVSIPVVRRVYSEAFIGWELVSVQTSQSPQPIVYNSDQYGNLKESNISCKTRGLHSYFPVVKILGEVDEEKYVKTPLAHSTTNPEDNIFYDGGFAQTLKETNIAKNATTALDVEAELSAWVAANLCNEINAEVIYDLTNHAKTKTDYVWKNSNHFTESLYMLSSVCERECLKAPNWFVISKNLVDEIKTQENFKSIPEKSYLAESKINKVGVLNDRWNVYSNSGTENQVLCGYKGKHYDAGYQYCPYIPMVETGYVAVSESLHRKRLMMRYGKRMWNNGFYAAMEVEGFKPTEEVKNEKL